MSDGLANGNECEAASQDDEAWAHRSLKDKINIKGVLGITNSSMHQKYQCKTEYVMAEKFL